MLKNSGDEKKLKKKMPRGKRENTKKLWWVEKTERGNDPRNYKIIKKTLVRENNKEKSKPEERGKIQKSSGR